MRSASSMHDLDQTIRERRSVRGFCHDRPVPRELVLEALELAQQAPSNCNVQPWRIFIAEGACCDRLRTALLRTVKAGEPPSPDDPIEEFVGDYRQLQIDCAVALYSEMGIERHDKEGRLQAFLRNFEFFDAPQVAIVCMEKQFGVGVALDVGMWVQTFMLALWARGVGSCAQASLRLYPQVIRHELKIPVQLRILCAVSFGYEDLDVPANRTRQTRDPAEKNVRFLA